VIVARPAPDAYAGGAVAHLRERQGAFELLGNPE
jgi:hypothetical protein